jgi:hypothetical protein
MAAINVLLSFERVKDLINSLPEETFKQDTGLANKKKMADAAIRQIDEFFDLLNEGKIPE